MKAEGLSQAAIDAFRLNYEQLVAGVTGLVCRHTVARTDAVPMCPHKCQMPVEGADPLYTKCRCPRRTSRPLTSCRVSPISNQNLSGM